MLENMAFRLFLSLAFVSLFLSPTISGYSSDQIKSMCSKTPHPKPCEYFLSNNPNYGPIGNDNDFLKVSLKLALDRALHAD
ncbi:pectinesterase inhibitor domain-containing protein, partial [Klebsiella pneumoniae]|uniref:pectinesterase inhibitor domain-containing protein n=1 Tax=Klebsiella pneumoniae TaxID=573 RepID=UPI003C6DA2F2